MGLKRPFDAEEMQECNAKHARQISYIPNHLNQLDESIPYHVSLDKTGVLEDLSGLCEKKPAWSNDANHVDKDFETCAPFSWISSGLCQETRSSSGSDVTWRPPSPVEDVYTCLMNQPPRKQVPIGSNHQADIPECVQSETRTNNDLERKLIGKCIIPMHDSDVCGTGQGRKECLCPDKGSVRCVRRHIMEARESLIETIGYERFLELGLCEMGDEVISLWSEDEEDLFHKVVYSNPASLGRDFWKHLKAATFPSRSMKEFVSYYFNVFILRRRATQNRVKTLDVDSDDDEWEEEYDDFCSGKSFDDENNEKEEEETSSSDDNDDDDDEDEDSPVNGAHCVYMDKASRGSDVNVEDESCMSFELQDSNLIFSHSPMENRSGDDSFTFDDACDRRLTSSDCWSLNNDLLPTSNIIEEIFGQDDWGKNDDNSKGK